MWELIKSWLEIPNDFLTFRNFTLKMEFSLCHCHTKFPNLPSDGSGNAPDWRREGLSDISLNKIN